MWPDRPLWSRGWGGGTHAWRHAEAPIGSRVSARVARVGSMTAYAVAEAEKRVGAGMGPAAGGVSVAMRTRVPWARRPTLRRTGQASSGARTACWARCHGVGGGPLATPACVGHAGGLHLGPDHGSLVPGRAGRGPPPYDPDSSEGDPPCRTPSIDGSLTWSTRPVANGGPPTGSAPSWCVGGRT